MDKLFLLSAIKNSTTVHQRHLLTRKEKKEVDTMGKTLTK